MVFDPVAILVGGSFVAGFFAHRYYEAAARQFGEAHILALPRGGTRPIEWSADWFNRRLEHDFPGCQVAVCCHSQSGLAVASSALDNPNILQVAAIGTPFEGTWTAALGWPLIQSTKDMLPESNFLRRLQWRLPELPAADRLATVSLRRDWVVPWPSSRVNNARNYFCGTQAEYESVCQKFPDARHIPVQSRLPAHVLGLQLLAPELERLLYTLWEHARTSAQPKAIEPIQLRSA